MNKFTNLFVSILFFSFLSSIAQNSTIPKPYLSAATQQYLWRIQKQHAGKPAVMPEYVYRLDAHSNIYVNAIIKIFPGFNESALNAIGAKVGTKAGNIWTTQVPIDKMNDFVQLNGIQFIDMDQPSVPLLDTARKMTKVDSVHNGYGLPQGYSGQGVVVGVIDAGFDYTHPTFYDTAYNAYRVKRVWEQKNITGTSPAGYAYGSEYSDSLSIITKAHDITTGTHGTHVAGIAGGAGIGSTGDARFRGMAYNSELVMVGIYPTPAYWLNTGMVDMLDGVSYTFDYAASQGKPAVANLSWGCPLGPHDGTSLFSQALDNLVGPGKIFVLSGGNNGTNNIHLKKIFTPSDTAVNTFMSFSTSLPQKRNTVDIWGDSAKAFSLRFSLYSGTTRVDSTIWISQYDSTYQFNLIGTTGDTCFLTVTSVASEFNGKPHVLVQAYSRVNDRLLISLKANDGQVNMWQGYVLNTSGYYGIFGKYGYSFAVNGDALMNVSDMVTTNSAIGVAAYNSKPSFLNISGSVQTYSGYTKGAIASFSSKGPTVDGRTKPNIAGPGLALASSVSSVDSTYLPSGANYSSVISNYVSPVNGITYSYAMAAGTSMSGPAVSGIIALLLEADPGLDPQEVMTILYNTAIRDSYTGIIPPTGSNTWGWGKVNAYHAMMEVLGLTTGIHHEEINLNCLLYPNPGKGNYNIEFVGNTTEILKIEVLDALGRKIVSEKWGVKPGVSHYQLELESTPSGIYFVSITGNSGRTTVKVIKE